MDVVVEVVELWILWLWRYFLPLLIDFTAVDLVGWQGFFQRLMARLLSFVTLELVFEQNLVIMHEITHVIMHEITHVIMHEITHVIMLEITHEIMYEMTHVLLASLLKFLQKINRQVLSKKHSLTCLSRKQHLPIFIGLYPR